MAGVGKRGPAPQLELRDWIPTTRAQAVDLETRLVAVGNSLSKASSIVGALNRLGELGDDGLSTVMRSIYRQELAKLGSPPWEGDGRSNTWSDISDDSMSAGRAARWRKRLMGRRGGSDPVRLAA